MDEWQKNPTEQIANYLCTKVYLNISQRISKESKLKRTEQTVAARHLERKKAAARGEVRRGGLSKSGKL